MRIIVCTKRDLAGTIVLNGLLPRLAGHQTLILLSDKTRSAEHDVPELAEMKFLERDLPISTLFPLVDRMGGGGRWATLVGLGQSFGVEIHQVIGVDLPETVGLIRDFAPDLMVSIRFSHIFKPETYEIPRFGTYNLHPGELPHYAGLFAPFRALLQDEGRVGCTLHRVDAGIDTGPIAGIGWLPVDRRRSLLWHVVHAYGPGLDLVTGLVASLNAGFEVITTVQEQAQRRYGTMPDAEDFSMFRQKGLRLYDPQEYSAILADFLPVGLHNTVAGLAPVGEEQGGTCCYAGG